jgi:hypothetical protein
VLSAGSAGSVLSALSSGSVLAWRSRNARRGHRRGKLRASDRPELPLPATPPTT